MLKSNVMGFFVTGEKIDNFVIDINIINENCFFSHKKRTPTDNALDHVCSDR